MFMLLHSHIGFLSFRFFVLGFHLANWERSFCQKEYLHTSAAKIAIISEISK